MRLLSALALTVAALAAVFVSCETGAPTPPSLDAGGSATGTRNPNDAPMPPTDVFQAVDATLFPDGQYDGGTTGMPDAL
jgi:hypothetical protein